MRIGLGIGMRKPSGQTLNHRAFSILRSYGNPTNLNLTTVVADTATSTGPITIAAGGTVEVLPNKTWRIV